MSRGAQDRKEGAVKPINLAADYPSIYFHLQDKRAAQSACETATPEVSKKLLEHYRNEATISWKKLQTTIEISDHKKYDFSNDKELFYKPAVTITELLQAKKRSRYFRGMEIDGERLALILKMDLSGVDFGNCVFKCDVDFTKCNLKNANFQGAVFEKRFIVNDADLRGANFKDVEVSKLQTSINTKTSGRFSSSLLQKNKFTKIKSQTYDLGEGTTITIQKTPNYKIFISGVEYDSRKFWNYFVAEYQKLRKKGGFGDQIKRLEKLSVIEKIDALFVHVQEDNRSRTLKALQNIVRCVKPQSVVAPPKPPASHPISPIQSIVSQDTDESRDSETSRSPANLQATLTPEEVVLQDVIDDEGFARRIAADIYERENRLLSEKIKVDAAEIMLRSCLQSIDSFEKNSAELLKRYRCLKEKGRNTRFVDVLIEEHIFPQFLKLMIYPEAPKVFSYKMLEALFKESSLPSEIKTIISQGGFISSGHSRFIAANIPEFLSRCYVAWGKTPLQVLAKINFIDKETMLQISEKMKAHEALSRSEYTCVEKQYYIAALIEQGKYREAEREAQALRAAYPSYAFEKDEKNIFSNIIQNIRKKLIESVEKSLSAAVSSQDEEKVVCDFDRACQPEHIQTIFSKLIAPEEFHGNGEALLAAYSKLYYFKSPVIEAIHTTFFMRNLANKVLLKRCPLAQDDLKHLFSLVNKPFVWIAGKGERQSLLQLSGQDNDVSMFIKGMVGKSIDAKKLLSNNLEIIKASEISSEDFEFFANALLDIPSITNDLKKLLLPVWLEYGPIKRAITKLPNGDLKFSDPEKLETRKLIDNPECNMIKLEQAKALYELYKKIELETVGHRYSFERMHQVAIFGDRKEMRESYQKERHVVQELLPINQISKDIGELRALLDNCLSDLGKQASKTFGLKIAAASTAIRERKKLWERHVAAQIEFREHIPEEPIAMAYGLRTFTN